MNEIELGEIIAIRHLDWVKPDGTTSSVVVNIGMPRRYPGSTDFYTPYQINGIGREEVWYAGGIDAIQSIQLVMGMIKGELNALREKLRADLRWVGDDAGGFGFD